MTVAEAIARLGATLETAHPKLLALSEEESRGPGVGMTWSRKEILGHLVDSASNNHQRFVRAQLQPRMSFPPYVQDQWIGAQGYGERPWTELVELWRLYNRHLLHVMKRVPATALGNVCVVSDDEPSTLSDHMVDYVLHLHHHLGQILG
jgi:hypothetical protein